MRLDKFLKVSRLIKRRTVANEACDNARVTVNGRPAKASYDVKVGDKLQIQFGAKALCVEVLQVAETVYADEDATQERIDAAADALLKAIRALTPTTGKNPETSDTTPVEACFFAMTFSLLAALVLLYHRKRFYS